MSDDDLFREAEAEAGQHRQSFGAFSRGTPREENALALALALDAADLADPALYPFKGTLTETQRLALGHAAMRPGHAFWIDAGGGKSGACIAEASRAYAEGLIDGVVITAPMGPHAQWIDEQFPRWCAVPWRGIDCQWSLPRIRTVLGRANDDVMGVLTINHEALRTDRTKKLFRAFRQVWPRFYFAIDESSRFKSPTAQRTRAMIGMARLAAFRRALSGTPILRGVEDLFTQYDAIEPGVTGFHAFTAFRRYYCVLKPVPGHRFATMTVGYRNQGELARRTQKAAIAIPSSVFHASDPLFMRVRCPMTREQAAAYREMKTDLVAEIDAERITASNALAQMGKLLQIASGYAYDNDGAVRWIADNKIDAVHALLDELDEPVVLFAPFVPLLERLEETLVQRGDRPVIRYRDRQSVIDWTEAGGVILGNQGSGLGIGQNLQAGAATIYAANSFAAEARWQSLKRTDRMGQTRQPRYWDLVAPGTVDTAVIDRVLAGKADIMKRTLEALQAMRSILTEEEA